MNEETQTQLEKELGRIIGGEEEIDRFLIQDSEKVDALTPEKKIELCRSLILNEMKRRNASFNYWNGEHFDRDPQEHYSNIVNWCKTNLKNKCWSSCKTVWRRQSMTSYGAKHECEIDLHGYVAENWMKMAMIDAGLDVCSELCIYYSKRLVREKVHFTEILANGIHFFYRQPKVEHDMIDNWIE